MDFACQVVTLLNDAACRRFIADQGVRSREDARAHIENEFLTSYATHGFGPCCGTLKPHGTPIGLCGLLRREWLAAVDIG
ncbi:MAG: hypothetical protein ACT443_07690 [Gemmatimonadota bacterium]